MYMIQVLGPLNFIENASNVEMISTIYDIREVKMSHGIDMHMVHSILFNEFK